jgi:hypothetical protein
MARRTDPTSWSPVAPRRSCRGAGCHRDQHARRRRDRRLDNLIESVNKRAKPYAFYTQLKLVKEAVQQLPTATLVRELEAWLDEVDRTFSPERLQAAAACHALPSREFDAADWKLRFVALPVAAEKRGRLTGPIIGVGPIETRSSNPGARVRNAVSQKGSRYGSDVPYPLVVALAIEELGAHVEEDIAVALSGQTPWTPGGREDGYRRLLEHALHERRVLLLTLFVLMVATIGFASVRLESSAAHRCRSLRFQQPRLRGAKAVQSHRWCPID